MNGALIVVVIIVLGIAAGSFVVHRIMTSAEVQLLRYAAKSIKNGDINDHLSTTPKSLSSMDKIFLPQIQKDFPEFNWNEFKAIIQQSILNMLRALDERRPGLVADNPVLYEAVTHEVQNVRLPHYKDIIVHNTVIKRYYKNEGTCYILCESAVEYYCYVEENGKVVSGYKDRKRQEVYETELVYVQNIEGTGIVGTDGVGLTCPNCGAPITNLGMKHCEYCGSAVEPLNIRVWKVNSIKLVS